MYALEYKEHYKMNGIGNTKQAGVFTFRWKQACLCEDEQTLLDVIKDKREPSDWRVEKMAF